jgi:integrase
MGELLALHVEDIDWSGSALIISRAVSAGVERGTKSGRVRQVPLADHAAGALARVMDREDFTGRGEFMLCNAYGRRLDGSALLQRYIRARDAIGLRPLRWHDLRHTFGSLLVAGGIDLVSVKDAIGHSQLTTTSRYLHARPAKERAAAITAAFGGMNAQSAEPAQTPARGN